MCAYFLHVSYYPQDPIMMEICVKLGIICAVEIPIVNTITKLRHSPKTIYLWQVKWKTIKEFNSNVHLKLQIYWKIFSLYFIILSNNVTILPQWCLRQIYQNAKMKVCLSSIVILQLNESYFSSVFLESRIR